MQKKIEEILKTAGDQQVNLQSEAARERLAKEIIEILIRCNNA